MPDFLDQKYQEITSRLNNLKPAVDEYTRLISAANALAALDGSTATSAASAAASLGATRRRPGRPRGSGSRTTTATSAPSATATPVKTSRKKAAGRKGRGGRPKGSGNRAAETLAAVQAQPGITMAELATKIGIKPNYLYRVIPPLQKEGKIAKKGKGWHPKR